MGLGQINSTSHFYLIEADIYTIWEKLLCYNSSGESFNWIENFTNLGCFVLQIQKSLMATSREFEEIPVIHISSAYPLETCILSKK